ncbi:GntR family transcriptional regulator, partial [Microbacterium sp.]|uniref:GntR family transcriptional regulator n=1 Tax=Microbacterium sp. TaxID=51671 RepID=UPI002634E260
MSEQITGSTATDIATSVRELHDRGILPAGSTLPPVRELASRLGVNRNTAVAAYRQLAQAGLVVTRGRAGTILVEHDVGAQEGYAADTVLRDVGTGNPDPTLIPDPSPVLA